MHDGADGRRAWRRGRDALAGANAPAPGDVPASSERFGVGRVLATGLGVWFSNIVPFLLITALLSAPAWLWPAIAAHGEPTRDTLRMTVLATALAPILALPVNALVAATLTYGVVMQLHGQRASIGACIATGFARFLPALVVGIVSWLPMAVAGFVWVLVKPLGQALLIPGAIVLCMLYVATPASVLERPGITGAFRRSAALTHGRRWRILVLLVLLGLVQFATAYLTGRVALSHLPRTPQEFLDNTVHQIYVDFALSVIIGSLSAVMTSVSYYYLRAEKEGTSTAELAAIFD